MFKLPLSERQRFARNKRERYQYDPEYRLARINERRRRDGLPEYASLACVELRTPLAPMDQRPPRQKPVRKPPSVPERGARGRFLPAREVR